MQQTQSGEGIAAEGNDMAKRKLTVIERLDQIPAFASEGEEHACWSTHEFSDALWEKAEPLESDELPPPRPSATPVTVWLDEGTLKRVKGLARRRRESQQGLLMHLLSLGLTEEERRSS